jgi:hypothetical protein
VVVGFLQPTYEIIVQVFSPFDAQEVNDAGVLLLRFLDAAMLQASGQDEDDIEPVGADGHGRKDRSHLEKNPCLRRRNHDLAASSDQVVKPLVQLDNLLRLAIKQLRKRELAAGVGLVAVLELAAAAWTGPQGSRLGLRQHERKPHQLRPPILPWPVALKDTV